MITSEFSKECMDYLTDEFTAGKTVSEKTQFQIHVALIQQLLDEKFNAETPMENIQFHENFGPRQEKQMRFSTAHDDVEIYKKYGKLSYFLILWLDGAGEHPEQHTQQP